eukprot:TRINITY_DN406_c1_g1_i1.p1 TRINITY_DN406_c1_g1~~TRINITY_DN406_c1_g1_i1.p1  ORF type:complete len:249 (-),score=88.04 TRINITY_DN406_c1_g1_i1:17-763(-)
MQNTNDDDNVVLTPLTMTTSQNNDMSSDTHQIWLFKLPQNQKLLSKLDGMKLKIPTLNQESTTTTVKVSEQKYHLVNADPMEYCRLVNVWPDQSKGGKGNKLVLGQPFSRLIKFVDVFSPPAHDSDADDDNESTGKAHHNSSSSSSSSSSSPPTTSAVLKVRYTPFGGSLTSATLVHPSGSVPTLAKELELSSTTTTTTSTSTSTSHKQKNSTDKKRAREEETEPTKNNNHKKIKLKNGDVASKKKPK